MKRKWLIILALLAPITSVNLFAANAPIQRIDVVNILGNSSGGVTETPVVLSFDNGGSAPCFTTTLAFQGATTLWAGIGQSCVSAVTSLTVTPIAGSGSGTVYVAPPISTINNTFYSAQITIAQNTPPQFDPSDGSITTAGTVLVTTVSHFG